MRYLGLRLLQIVAVAAIVGMAQSPASATEVPGPIRFLPKTPESWIRLDAKFAPEPDKCAARQPRNLHAGYPGVLEVGRRADGRLYLVTELDFPRYLQGIAEVPRSWPVEALKAQIVAARTYAVSHMNPSTGLARELRYNLCATDACQVYRGRVVEAGAWGEVWSQAVTATQGEILEAGGKPASTFYFSTSNGQTYSNEEVFGGTALSYLKPVTEADDGESPVSSWIVRMPFEDMSEALRLAGSWSGGDIESVRGEGGDVVLQGGGRESKITVDRLRTRLNSQAVCLTPKRYPTQGRDGRSLPQVIPSKWFTLRQEGREAVFDGRGWGHGVGMVQWGLKGKAQRGMSYSDMLAFYYGGLRPTRRSDPGIIRIGLAIGIESVALERIGAVEIQGASLPGGPLLITGGASLNVNPGESAPPVLQLLPSLAPVQTAAGAPITFEFDLSAAANVRLAYKGGASEASTPFEPTDRGEQSVIWDVSGLSAGSYDVAIEASDGVDTITTAPMMVRLSLVKPAPSSSPSPLATTSSRSRPGILPWLLAISGLMIVMGAGGYLATRWRRTRGRDL